MGGPESGLRRRPDAWGLKHVALYQALSPEQRRIKIEDARACNPRWHRLFSWLDPRGSILRIAGTYWTIVEEANVTPEDAPTVYQVALNTLRGALLLGPLTAPPEPIRRT